MKRLLLSLVLLILTGNGCGQKEAPKSKAPPGPLPTIPTVASPSEAPPPPGEARVAAAPTAPAQRQIPTYEGKDEAEKLTKALHDYYERGGAEVKVITSLEALVKAGYLKSVPVPPAGKKYVVTTKYPLEVRLENK